MGRFLTELRRRKVFQVAVIYAGVAWLLAQGAVILFDTYSTLAWVQPVFIGVLILGFPLAIILAWALETTPEATRRWQVARVTSAVVAGGAIASAGYLFLSTELATVQTPPFANIDVARSIAVLPLNNLSPDPEDSYFAAGIHEEILSQLSRIADMRVISRTSVMQYADTDKTVGEIGAELGVGTIMEGSVRYADDRVRITVQLISTADDAHLWAEVYDRDLQDIFAIQTDIAERIAQSLQAELTEGEADDIQEIPTENMAAYALYLRSLRHIGPDARAVAERRRYLEDAIELDSDFAQAYEQLALAYSQALHSDWYAEGEGPENGDFFADQVRWYAGRALSIDPELELAHIALAYVYEFELDWARFAVELDRARQIAPNSPAVLWEIAILAAAQGDFEQSASASRRMIELAPNIPEFHLNLAVRLWAARQFDESIVALEDAIELAPAYVAAHCWYGILLFEHGDFDGAIEEFRLTERLMGDEYRPTHFVSYMAMTYRQMEMPEEVERLHSVLERLSRERHVSAMTWAQMFYALGDYEAALDHVHRSIDQGDDAVGALAQLNNGRGWELVWDHPRFQDARSKLGFTD